jgi:hypothetical protein
MTKNPFYSLAILGIIFLYISSVMTWDLASFPGLHGDEAWLGLNAEKILREGTRTIHGMNTYTGVLYSGLVALFFQGMGITVFSLRMVGVIFNWLGLIMVAMSLYRYLDRQAALLATFLFLASSSYLLFPRIAWEVCALQGFFLAIHFAILLRYLKTDRLEWGAAYTFFLITALGVLNHFIFIYESLGLTLATVLIAIRYCNRQAIELLALSLLSLVMVMTLYISKPSISEDDFQKYWLILLVISLLFLGIITFIFEKIRELSSSILPRILPHRQFWSWVVMIPIIGIVCFLLFQFITIHSWSFFGTISGIVVIERLSSYSLNNYEKSGLEIAWGALLLLFVIRGIQKIYRQSDQEKMPIAVFFFLYTFSCLLFISLAPGTSDRYYIIPLYLLLFSFPIVVMKETRRASDRSFWLGLSLVLGITISITQSLLWKNILQTDNRVPITVRYGNYQDLSHHFLKLDDLATFLEEKQICKVDEETNFFIKNPLEFLGIDRSFPCDPNKTVRIEYCETCLDFPKYFRIQEVIQTKER